MEGKGRKKGGRKEKRRKWMKFKHFSRSPLISTVNIKG
jgi:hypothetical protein